MSLLRPASVSLCSFLKVLHVACQFDINLKLSHSHQEVFLHEIIFWEQSLQGRYDHFGKSFWKVMRIWLASQEHRAYTADSADDLPTSKLSQHFRTTGDIIAMEI